MDIQDCIRVVEKLLQHQNKQHKNSHDQMIYERGYLTGFLARLMITDPRVRSEIIELVKKK